ncbi:hypothetical protein [Burkholderia ubonensis]|uniref:Uncharacterized protein n=1 Tax=Burkholderia ubonensis TaxID=101571 RepID=A0A107FP26_9BURK|nr:hypothetical protein [Burkholderia ubonensis]KWD85134.1 hypothetical protein WL70_13780 [Burkholderia ubonensis]KWD92340.1 hypothetical protein WL71_03495 [Burkholderia ubonensis]KWD94181.1 hypothetical protein WL72_26155 [Burkholderia ubonensis]KWD97060.1 hypothetical protein WL73_21700 [Burkholderia ubonensis]
MSAIRPLKPRDPPQVVAESLGEPRDTVTAMIDTAHAIVSRLEIQMKELHEVLGPVLPLFEEPVPELIEEPTPGPKAVRQLHHLCERMTVISAALDILARDAAI